MTSPAPSQRVRGAAVFSDCGRYRYLLTRDWGDSAGPISAFIMLNPSTASADRDDATLRRVTAFARGWGCSGVVVANLYGWRATDPGELNTAADPIGPENDLHVVAAVAAARESGGEVIAAWGARAPQHRVDAVLALPGLRQLQALVVTRAGQPGHPLYLPGHLTPRPWPGRRRLRPVTASAAPEEKTGPNT